MHVDRHRYLYDKLAPLVSPSLLERFWRLPSSTFCLAESPPLEGAGIFAIFVFDTPIYICKSDHDLDELSDQYASILSGEWVDACDVDPRVISRQRFAWEAYLEHSFDDANADSVDQLLPLEDYEALFLSVDSATELSMWVSLLISSLRPACNIDVYDDAVGRAIVLDDLSDPPTGEEMQRLVKIDGRYIRYLQTPDEAIQLSAVRENPWALGQILNMGLSPSYPVILAALEGNGLTLKLIKEADRQMQEVAVNRH